MGLAASQARYLALTARKSNVEFEGQLVNQQRTELANESAGIFAEMMQLETPTPPSETDYYKETYNFNGSSSTGTTYNLSKWDQIEAGSNKYNFNKVTYTTSTGGTGEFTGTGTLSFYDSGRIKGITFESFGEDTPSDIQSDIGTNIERSTEYSRYYDEEGYTEAMTQYKYDQDVYNKKISELSAKTEEIQVQDRTLELQLRQLDTEQEALQTEIESVKKVIDSNVERVFKTFQD